MEPALEGGKSPVPGAEKLYVVVRADLGPGLQAAQAAHAVVEFALELPELAQAWRNGSNTIVLVGVPNARRLLELIEDARIWEVPHTPFYDPDLAPMLSAVALSPSAQTADLCRGFPLLLRARERPSASGPQVDTGG